MTAEAYRRMLVQLLPRSRLWRQAVDAVLGKVFLATGDELVRVDERAARLVEESDPRTAEELLPEYESELGLVSTGTIEQRRARIEAQLLLEQRYRPVDFQTALAPLFDMAAGDIQVIEHSRAYAIAVGDDREIFRFFVLRDPVWPGTPDLVAAQELVDLIKPSHTVGHVIESSTFLCDSPYSLCDRDILGV